MPTCSNRVLGLTHAAAAPRTQHLTAWEDAPYRSPRAGYYWLGACGLSALMWVGIVQAGMLVGRAAGLLGAGASLAAALLASHPSNDGEATAMGLKAALIALILCLCVFAFAVFEGASITLAAFARAEISQASQSPSVRAAIRARTQEALSRSWARPLLWRADAAEARSALALLAASDPDPSPGARAQSARWAERALAQSPLQSNAWTRLADLTSLGEQSPLCDPKSCLDYSYRAEPVARREAECVRLKIANRAGLFDPNAPAVRQLADTAPLSFTAQCFSFLPRQQLFQILLSAKRAP